ncbi:MAG TPA: hypothetical protein VJ276_02235 [Thermoanaerobaculia bacterium]|nr:hypothetical protein [Thermoanaerobaculia bacterium]
MKPKTLLLLALTALLVVAGTAQAQIKISDTEDTKLFITLATVGTYQALDQRNVFDPKGVAMPALTSGMQTAYGDLGFGGKFGKKQEVEMYFDLYLASRNHPSTTYGNQGYLLVHDIPENLTGLRKTLGPIFKRVDVKAGAFLIDFGDQVYHRSNNALVQTNPLVGNFVIDPNLVSVGGEVMSKPGKYNWLVGITNGTNTEDYSAGRGIAYNAKVWAYPLPPLRLSASVFKADHSESATSRATLFSGNRSGERYGGVLGGGQAPGDVLANSGRNLIAYQFDATWDAKEMPIKLYGHLGQTKDKDLNGPLAGAPEESWKYYAGDVVFNLTKTLYAAARYSGANADQFNGAASSGKVRRIQFGGGLWVTRNMLMKVEWVDQKYTGFALGSVVNNGVDAGRDPSFKGLVSEVSFAF